MSDVNRITLEQFEALGPSRHPMILQFVEELEFYSALDGWYLGVLIKDRADHDFSFAVLGPDPSGKKRWIAGADSVPSVEAARERLLTTLGAIASKGKNIHRQE